MSLKNTLDSFGFDVVEGAKRNLNRKNKNASKSLSNSLDYKLKVSGKKDKFRLSFLMEDYGEFIDRGVKGKGGKKADGTIYTMPLMSQIWTLTSVQEKNSKGDWFGFSIKRKRQLDLDNAADTSLFETAVSFALSVKAGEVTAQEKSANATRPMDDEIPF